MGLPITHRDPHRRHAAVAPPAPAREAARHPAHHAGADRADAVPSRRRRTVRLASRRVDRSTSCMRSPRPSAAISWRSTSRGCARWPRISSPSASRRPWRGRPSCAAFLVPHKGQTVTRLAEIVEAGAGLKADIADPRVAKPSCRGPGTFGPLRASRDLRGDQGAPHDARLRQHALARPRCCSTRCGATTTIISPSRCTTARSTSASAARSRRPWSRANLRAVVCTSTLDLGIDWGDVDLVINVGAPERREPARPAHRPRQPPSRRAVARRSLVPANRFEVLECQAALEAAEEGGAGHAAVAAGRRSTCSPSMSSAWPASAPFDPDQLYRRGDERLALSGPHPRGLRQDRATSSPPAATRSPTTTATPSCARPPTDATASRIPRIAQQYRLNVGTIVEAPMVRVRLARRKGGALKPSSLLAAGRVLGEVEE